MKRLAVLFTGAAAIWFCIGPSYAQEKARVKIGSNHIAANGCHDNTQTFTTGIPEADHLDKSYQGVLAGIEVVETAANGTHAYRNFTFINDGKAISYQLYAKGGGHWVDPPKVFGTKIGGGVCVDASGASEGVDIFAHYVK